MSSHLLVLTMHTPFIGHTELSTSKDWALKSEWILSDRMSSLDDIRWKQCVFICIWINSKNNKANCMSECILSRRMDAKHVDSSQPNLLGGIAPRRFGATHLLFLVHSPWHNLCKATVINNAQIILLYGKRIPSKRIYPWNGGYSKYGPGILIGFRSLDRVYPC